MVSDLPITCHFFPQPAQCGEEKSEKNARKEPPRPLRLSWQARKEARRSKNVNKFKSVVGQRLIK